MVVRVHGVSDTGMAGKQTTYPTGGNGTTSVVSMRSWKCDASVWARARSRTSSPVSMLRTSAFGVRLADVTKTSSLSWTTALAWRTAPGPSPVSMERGQSLTSSSRVGGCEVPS